LFSFGDDVRLSLGFLLRDLFLLDGVGELLAEDEVGDRDVVEDEIESGGALRERFADLAPATRAQSKDGDV